MRLRWTEPAVHDLKKICDYVDAHDGAAAARRIALRIYEGLDSLTEFPHRGRPGRKSNTRELVLPGLPWLAIYRVRENVIEVNRILHGAQRFP
jgi:addiction module RelE/StbE family toxin